MKKRAKALLRTHKSIRKLRLDLLEAVHINSDTDKLREAKELHARIYREIDFVDDSDIIDGVLSHSSDPHQIHSYYFGVYNKLSGDLLAVARHIESHPDKGYRSFPVLNKANIYEKYLSQIKKVEPTKIVEISALVRSRHASQDAILFLLREMLCRSLYEGHEYWLMALDTNYHKSLRALFGDTYHKIGDIAHYKGGDVIPCILSPQQAIKNLNKKQLSKNLKTFGAHSRIAEFFADISNEQIEGIK